MSSFLTPDQVDQLEQQGRIGPDLAQSLRSQFTNAAGAGVKTALGAVPMVGPAVQALGAYGDINTMRSTAAKNAEAQGAAALNALPDAQPAPAAPPPPQAQGFGDFGLGGISRGIAANQKATDKAMADAEKDKATAYGEQRQAIQSQAELEAQKAAELASASRVQTQAMEATDAAAQQREAERQQHLDGVADELRSLQKEARDYKINPDRRTGGEKALGAIAAFIGGLGGGHNDVLDMIQQQISNDINAQRDELASKRAAVGDKTNELGMMRQRFGDQRAAEEAFRSRELERYKKQIEDLTGEYAAPEVQARAQQAIGVLDAAQADSQASVIAQANNRFLQGAQAQASIAGERGRLSLEEQQLAAKGGGVAPPAGMALIPGQRPTKEAIEKAQEIKSQSDAVKNSIQRLVDFRAKNGVAIAPDKRREAETLLANAVEQYSKNISGRFSKEVEALARDAIGGSPGGVFDQTTKYQTLLRAIDADTAARLKPYGFQPEGGGMTSAEADKAVGAR